MPDAPARPAARLRPVVVLAALAPPALADPPASVSVPAVVVTATRERTALADTPASVGAVDAATLAELRASHPAQVLGLVPGVAVAVTSGEGHTTAIRQGFTTSPVYLFLEDGVPVRSTGFFNHNALYEVNLAQAGGVEVIRGPGSALYGSDAIGGIVNVLSRRPPEAAEASVSLEAGSFGWHRLLVDAGTRAGPDGVRATLNATRTDGWRARTAYDRLGGSLRWDRDLGDGASLRTLLSFSGIDQETGASSPLVRTDFEGDPTRNNFPIAYRKVEALRLSSAWERPVGAASLLGVTPYLRHDRMELLAAFTLASDPTVHVTANQSAGVQVKWRTDFEPLRTRLMAGLDLDQSPGGRQEDRLNVSASGTGASRVFSDYTVGARVYDYDVRFRSASPWLHLELSPLPRLRLTAGLRHDALSYRLDNRLEVAAVAAGGRFYGQAGDTTLRFSRTSPKLGATWSLGPDAHLFASFNQGFRAPSENQLFRPASATGAAQAAASVASALRLEPITATQAEVGARGTTAGLAWSVAAYDLRKRNDIVSLRDTATNLTESVNAGQTRHRGVEVGADAPVGERLWLSLALSRARHTYEDWRAFSSSTGANRDFSGREIESSPRTLGSASLVWTPADALRLRLDWVRVGAYWLDQANSARYEGHDLFHLRASWTLSRELSLFASVLNLADRRTADSASVSSSTPVFSPGLPRTLGAGAELRW